VAEQNNLIRQFSLIDTRLIAVAISFLFSLIVIVGSPIPNDDAFSYIRAAELFNSQGLEAVLTSYGWYGYSVLISLVGKILPIGLISSAHLLNMLSFALLVYAFITLASEFRQTETVKIFAAIVILCFPTINEMRYYLIRDFAYWGFCLTALVQLIRYNKTQHLLYACGWLLAMTAAVFFRLEGLLILILSPFALLVGNYNSKHGIQNFLKLTGLILIGALLILLLFFLAGINLIEIFQFTYRWYLPLLANYSETIAGAANNSTLSFHISEQMAIFSGKGLFVLVIGYLYSVVANIFMTLGPPASLFLAYFGIIHKQRLTTENKWPWFLFLGSSLLALIIFVSIMQFLTTRYAVMAALLLLSLAPLSLDTLYQQALQSGKRKKFQAISFLLVFYFLVDSLVSFGYSKNYIREAIDWSQENVADGSLVLTNSFPIAYYSGLVADYDKILPQPEMTLALLENQEYLVMDIAHDDNELLEQLGQHPRLSELQRFSNRRNDAIIIFDIRNRD
jgi:hypothetical protein